MRAFSGPQDVKVTESGKTELLTPGSEIAVFEQKPGKSEAFPEDGIESDTQTRF